ncbi:MAG TPA: outer membrane beta-barrel protein [Thiotrichales bacterium]|nr:outer membrane beta-barrel protein [Thiotrichales bacterium]
MKKTILATLVASGLLATAAVNAAGFDGVYAGADVGFTKGEWNETGFDMSGNQTNFGLNLGYGATMGNFYLAGELAFRNNGADFGDKNITLSGIPVKVGAKATTTKMISILPGFVVSKNTLIYARLGRGNTDMEYTATNLNNGASFTQSQNGDFNIYGLGMNYLMTTNLSVVAEVNRAVGNIDNGGDATMTSLNAGINYRF